MKKGVCPKCTSTEIYSGPKSSGAKLNSAGLPITAFTSTQLLYYVCVTCGYAESYITEQDVFGKIKEKWDALQK